jgi:hypothetical protein
VQGTQAYFYDKVEAASLVVTGSSDVEMYSSGCFGQVMVSAGSYFSASQLTVQQFQSQGVINGNILW